MILAIDPGTTHSAWVLYGPNLECHGIEENERLLTMLYDGEFGLADHMAIEIIASYGMAVGREVFETCVWIGRFIEAMPRTYSLVYRREVKLHLCNSAKAKDANIRQALIDRFPATGGGKVPQIGTKSKPGPLFGVAKDVWAALAVAVTYTDRQSRS